MQEAVAEHPQDRRRARTSASRGTTLRTRGTYAVRYRLRDGSSGRNLGGYSTVLSVCAG